MNILNMVYTFLFFLQNVVFFYNSNIFYSCVIHILYTGCAKIKSVAFYIFIQQI